MNPPCGHPGATCILGNFWICPTCDAAPALGLWETPREVKVDLQSQIQAEFEKAIVGAAKRVAPGRPVIDKDAGGDIAVATDPDGHRTFIRRNKLYGLIYFTGRESPELVKGQIHSMVHCFLSAAKERIAAVVESRGWNSRYHITTLGGFPHLVCDDGAILKHRDPEHGDGLEVRMRAFWRVLPGDPTNG